MKIFLDESCNMKIVTAVRAMFQDHTFLVAGIDSEKGILDIPLYPIVADLGCEVYICADNGQLDTRPAERAACRKAGLHWVGLRKVPAKGKRGATADAARLIAAFLHILDDIKGAGGPRYYRLERGPKNADEAIDEVGEL
ncbi:hypothetical protein [Mycolicibacterium vanbaalenii]|uniref:Uncharacterized protein n=1 Tax=Mycolicibacterium vanbaalenii (strain DSM 7251 / JCM 13017 / BCRC 16820 / KCTC 9966 / NRRL B-24157 / PYR-1) TaxID=350058 RepID=A1TD83_MYCVP|nr:hypothetical protein [Mycolicibacterium vanbaalenii]ABM15133.1 hypothetical protein Mvan_4356 [Mycolicibacterium vanbaalenii PYR-1]MCV7127012.1 hypothetical protein [Mycolicibacterium vanbaalenii PYR-1]